MSRDNLASGTSDELSAQQVNLVFFVEIEFQTGTITLWSGLGDFSWDSKTWLGVGNLLMIKPADETTSVTATGLIITLSGIDPVYIALALIDARQNKPVKCWFGFLDSSGNLIDTPYQYFSGLVNYVLINEGRKTATVTITAENDLIKLQQPRVRRYTDQDQQGEYDGDLGFLHVASLQEWNGFWGGGDTGASESRSDGGTLRDAREAAAERAEEQERQRQDADAGDGGDGGDSDGDGDAGDGGGDGDGDGAGGVGGI